MSHISLQGESGMSTRLRIKSNQLNHLLAVPACISSRYPSPGEKWGVGDGGYIDRKSVV